MSAPSHQPFTAGLPANSLAQQVIVIAGAEPGLAQHLANTFTHLGARVVVADVAGEANATAGVSPVDASLWLITTDPDDDTSLSALVEQTRAEFGPVAALIQCVPPASAMPVLDISTAAWDDAVSRSLRRVFRVSQAFLPGMLARRQGAFLNIVYLDAQPGLAAVSAAQHGLAGFTQALAVEAGAQGVRAVALAATTTAAPEQLAGAAAYTLALLLPEFHGAVVSVAAVLERAGFGGGSLAAPPGDTPAPDRAASLAQALTISQQLASLLMDTDSDFDRLPVAVRPMARGAFLSKVGYRSQDVLRAVHKLGEQIVRMQASHSATDTEFQVDYPRLAGLFERLINYYQAVPDETARFTNDPILLGQLRRQMAERQALIEGLLTALTAVHAEF